MLPTYTWPATPLLSTPLPFLPTHLQSRKQCVRVQQSQFPHTLGHYIPGPLLRTLKDLWDVCMASMPTDHQYSGGFVMSRSSKVDLISGVSSDHTEQILTSSLPLSLLFCNSPHPPLPSLPHPHHLLPHLLKRVQQEVLPPWLGLNLLQDHWQVQLQVACTGTAQSIRGSRSDLLSGGTEGTNDHIQQGSVGAEVTVRSGGGRGGCGRNNKEHCVPAIHTHNTV